MSENSHDEPLKVGDRVKIIAGIFENFTAEIVPIEGDELVVQPHMFVGVTYRHPRLRRADIVRTNGP